jgi:cellulose synthase/poly-beta-1,6-N-acetylglucosamine synthase-like glycosyltransferase
MGQVELSFVVPAYNEEAFIEDTLVALDEVVKNEMLPYEIVVVNEVAKMQLWQGKRGTREWSC